MSTTGAYARYSDDEHQRATSIEDQLRRCHQVAQREGLSINDALVFVDGGVTGKAEGRSRRAGYQRFIDAVEGGVCTVVIADEISRLTRHMREGAVLIDLVEHKGLRVITADGVDTSREGWKLQVMVRLMTAVYEVDSTSARTARGMLGALHRGFQIAQPPYGYRAIREQSPERGGLGGTKWVINEEEASVVRKVYQARHAGMSLVQVSAMLMREGVAPPVGRDGLPSYWMPGRVRAMLNNAIYRGAFVWNGSSFTKAKARKRRKTVVSQEFPRPQLRIVSDELWYACTAREALGEGPQRVPRGGGRHLFSGLVTCGDCNALLCVSGGPVSYGLHCPGCEVAVRVGGRNTWVGYTSVAAARLALEWGLSELFNDEAIATFRQRLKERFEAGPQREQRELQTRVQQLEAVMERLKRLALNPAVGAELFEGDLVDAASQLRVARARLDALTSGDRRLTEAQLQAQLSINPLPLLRELLNGGIEAYRVRATLRRLLAKFSLVARPRSGVSVFKLAFRPGVCVAELADSVVIDADAQEYEVVVSCTKSRPTRWSVKGRRCSPEVVADEAASVEDTVVECS
jgi:DNA invertase Pin-like site-specific DNA recombinase